MGYRRQDRLLGLRKWATLSLLRFGKNWKTLQTETKEKVISAKNYFCFMIKRLFHNRSEWTHLGCFYLAFYCSTRQSKPKRKLFSLSFECNEISTHTLITLSLFKANRVTRWWFWKLPHHTRQTSIALEKDQNVQSSVRITFQQCILNHQSNPTEKSIMN